MLFVTGYGSAIAEVINTKSCGSTANLPDYPLGSNTYYANGGVLNDIPIICGGYVGGYIDKCYKFDKGTNSWVLFATLPKGRAMYHAVTLASKGALWLIGGKWAQNGYHKDTDMVFLNGTVLPGPTLPTARIDLCAVELHDGRVLIMGKPLILVINLVLVVMC